MIIKIIKHYINIIKNKNIENFTDKKFNGRNVYNMTNFGKEMTFVHRIIKKMFIIPAIMFFEWYFKGKLKTSVDDSYQFRKLKIFYEADKLANEKWNTLYRPYAYGEYIEPKSLINDSATKRLIFLTHLYLTVIMGDTAYLEKHNFLMDEIYNGMKNIDKEHILYTNKNINDFRYFILTDGIKKGEIILKEVLGEKKNE